VLAAGIALLYVPQEIANSGQPSALATVTVSSAYAYGVMLCWQTACRRDAPR
jgi:hypothetical protein